MGLWKEGEGAGLEGRLCIVLEGGRETTTRIYKNSKAQACMLQCRVRVMGWCVGKRERRRRRDPNQYQETVSEPRETDGRERKKHHHHAIDGRRTNDNERTTDALSLLFCLLCTHVVVGSLVCEEIPPLLPSRSSCSCLLHTKKREKERALLLQKFGVGEMGACMCPPSPSPRCSPSSCCRSVYHRGLALTLSRTPTFGRPFLP